MSVFQRIVVGVDGSDPSNAAVALAVRVARDTNESEMFFVSCSTSMMTIALQPHPNRRSVVTNWFTRIGERVEPISMRPNARPQRREYAPSARFSRVTPEKRWHNLQATVDSIFSLWERTVATAFSECFSAARQRRCCVTRPSRSSP